MNLKDNIVTGLVAGLVAPLVSFYIYSRIKLPAEKIWDIFNSIKELGILSAVLSLCVFVNLLVFFIFIWTHADRSARGVLMATFFYAFVIVILKLT
jgi:hypothetical protein